MGGLEETVAKVTPEEYADKQAQRLKASIEDIRRGVSRVQTSPGELAVRQKDKAATNYQQAISSGRWEKATRSVSVGDWQQATLDKGLARISGGIDAARSKQVQFASRLLPAVDAAAGKANQLPSTTLDDRINRSVAFMREMSKSKGTFKG